MSLRYAVLAELADRGPGIGHHVFKRVEERVGPAWRLNNGTVAIQLKECVDRAWVSVDTSSGKKMYRITDAGRAALASWSGEGGSEIGEYRNELVLRLLYDRSSFDRLLEDIDGQYYLLTQRMRELHRAQAEIPANSEDLDEVLRRELLECHTAMTGAEHAFLRRAREAVEGMRARKRKKSKSA